ncbi:hypothetical protein QN277_026873 [Acacia crassicarpa]|uniref:Uncharacterized protein n=1 Tax=Acacia crassicarpa TaxID=499986 RepID=A0AAE1J8V7_9FABA|nr:hypothetical protein QN277_026873 [Acacia crassicarpa]
MESELMMMRRLMAMLQEKESQAQASRTAGGYNSGTQGSFTNNGPGGQNFRDVNYNSGAYSGNRNSYPYYHNNGGNFVHNSGTTYGDGNGSIVNNNNNNVPSNRNSY